MKVFPYLKPTKYMVCGQILLAVGTTEGGMVFEQFVLGNGGENRPLLPQVEVNTCALPSHSKLIC